MVASDGDLSATQDVTVTVNDVNEAPDFDHDGVISAREREHRYDSGYLERVGD